MINLYLYFAAVLCWVVADEGATEDKAYLWVTAIFAPIIIPLVWSALTAFEIWERRSSAK